MRWYQIIPVVALLLFGVYAVAYGQESETLYVPAVKGGVAVAASPTPTNTLTATPTHTPTPTPTNTPTPTATSTSTATPTLTPTATEPAGQPVINTLNNWSYYIDVSNNMVIVGNVQNTGTANAAFVNMTADLLDAQGNVLATSTGIAYDRVIAPGELSCFRIVVTNPPPSNNVASVTFSSTFNSHVPHTSNLTIFDVSETYSSGIFRINGKVRNNATTTANNVVVSAVLYSDPNQQGLVVDCFGVNVDTTDIEPGQVSTFSVPFIMSDPSIIGSYYLKAMVAPE
jgi:hypothetical protein